MGPWQLAPSRPHPLKYIFARDLERKIGITYKPSPLAPSPSLSREIAEAGSTQTKSHRSPLLRGSAPLLSASLLLTLSAPLLSSPLSASLSRVDPLVSSLDFVVSLSRLLSGLLKLVSALSLSLVLSNLVRFGEIN